eukprot:13990047-Alexandrium_andersonii.AAC.1
MCIRDRDYGASAISAAHVAAVNVGIATSQIPTKLGQTPLFMPQGLSPPRGMENRETVVGLFDRGR